MILQSSEYVLPATEAFRQGRLELISTTDLPLHGTPVWSDFPLNIVLVIIAAFFLAFTLKSHYRIVPYLFPALSRTNAALSLEKNYQLTKQRNLAALSLFLPFCLLLDRFNVLKFPFVEGKIPAQWHFCITFAMFLAFVLLRSLMYHSLRPNHKQEIWHAAKTSAFNFFLVMSVLCLASSGLLIVFGVGDSVINTAIIYESSVVYIIFLARKCQILREGYSAFLTFLYLCALEVLPVLFLVAARFVTLI